MAVDRSSFLSDIRGRFISKTVAGKSFVDVGVLYWMPHEKVSIARAFGADRVAIIDLPSTGDSIWRSMQSHLEEKGVTDCEFIGGDVQTIPLRQFDIVHSSGVLYHVPNQIGFIERLRAMTKEYCILSTTIMPTEVEVDGEVLRTMDGSAVFLPGLRGRERDLFIKYWQKWGNEDITRFDGGTRDTSNFSPNWWFPTIGAFRGFAECAGFEIVDEGPVENWPVSYVLLLR